MSVDVKVIRENRKVLISPESGSEVIVYDPSRSAVASRLRQLFSMTRGDANYVANRVFSLGRRFDFNTSARFVYGGTDDIESCLQEQGGRIAAGLPGRSFGVYYHLDSRLMRFGDFAPTAALARKIREKALDAHPNATMEIVEFEGRKAKMIS